MHRGYIRLWRKSMESQVFQSDGLWKLWCYCLMAANHKDAWIPVHGLTAAVQVKRGQFITGRFALHKALYQKRRAGVPTPITLWRWLETLRDCGNLNIETNNRFTLVTVNSYGTYNDTQDENDQANDQPVISHRSAGDQPVITNKNDNNYKNEKNDKKFTPPSVAEVAEYCRERNNGIDPQHFIDYYDVLDWVPKGSKRRMSSWKAAVRTWERQKRETGNVPDRIGPGQRYDPQQRLGSF